MTAITGRTGNLVGFSTGRGTTPWDTEMEAALRKMDAMLASTVIGITNTLPGSANEGDLYLVGALPTGVAAGWANRIARWRSSPAGWEAYQPMQGWIITIVGESTNKVRRYNGTAWVAIATDAGAEPTIAGGTAAQYWSGLKSWTDFATSVRTTVLTGLSLASSAVVAATDSVLVAIGKLQAQVSSKLPSDNPAFTGVLTGARAALTGDVNAGGEIKSGALAGTDTRPLVALADGTIDDQDIAVFRGTISVPPALSFTGSVDAKALNGGKAGLYRLAASTYANFWTGITAGQQASVLQLESPTGLRTLIASDNKAGGLLTRFQASDFPGDDWSDWYTLWDSGNLPVGTTGRAVLATTTQAAARAAISAAPLAGAEIMIHSDFGRSATTDVWQSAFTNNTASGLQLAANTTATGTEIIIEQVVNIPADGGAAAYQVYIGPQLTGEQSPTGSTYSDVIDPSGAAEYGAGKIQIRIELIGSGTSIIGYVSSRFETGSSNAPFVRVGQITVNGTIANSIDVRFNPDSQTSYIIRRNRVFRRNP